MGRYEPAARRRRRSLTDALDEAEYEHYLDCPNADLIPRIAATMLDAIFLFIAVSAVNRILSLSPGLIGGGEGTLSPSAMSLLESVKIAIDVSIWYFSQIWSTANFGGSPAKLILGLRVIEMDSGAPLSFSRSVVRELVGKVVAVGVTGGLVLLVPLFRKDHQTFHDLLTRSAVKRVRPA